MDAPNGCVDRNDCIRIDADVFAVLLCSCSLAEICNSSSLVRWLAWATNKKRVNTASVVKLLTSSLTGVVTSNWNVLWFIAVLPNRHYWFNTFCFTTPWVEGSEVVLWFTPLAPPSGCSGMRRQGLEDRLLFDTDCFLIQALLRLWGSFCGTSKIDEEPVLCILRFIVFQCERSGNAYVEMHSGMHSGLL